MNEVFVTIPFMNVAVVGIGNVLLGDEGVGVHLVNHMKQSYACDDDVEWIDGGTMGLDLLPFVEGRDAVIFVDAMDFRNEPGYLQSIEGQEITRRLSGKLSVHQIALPDLLATLQLIENPPKYIVLVGIQPKQVDVGYELSETIMGKMDHLAEEVLKWLKRFNIRCVSANT